MRLTNVFLVLPLLATAVYLLATQIGQPASDLRPKVFVIGLSKTGTTSIGNALALLGYRRLGWKDIRSRHLVHTFINGDIDAALDQTRYFDAFEDLPWPGLYRRVAEMYPDARFVLSLRKDEQTWLRSMRRHMARGIWAPATYWYGAQFVDGHEDTVLAAYRNHTTEVRDFFRDQPHRYTELVIDDGDVNWERLCGVADCPGGRPPTRVTFPKSNTAEHWHDGDWIAIPSKIWGTFIGNTERFVSTTYYHRAPSRPFNLLLEAAWKFISVLELAICNLYYKIAVQPKQLIPTA